jgi:LysM domain.
MKKLFLLILIAALFMGCAQPTKNSYIITKEVVTVHMGDTVWGIASRYSGDIYMLEYLEELKALPENKQVLNANRPLQPGDKITVLKAKK